MSLIFDSDDFGCNHVISDQCQSHDCRDMLLLFKEANPKFKATLFAIPWEITLELVNWVTENNAWIELAWHGFGHSSNYECEKLDYNQFSLLMRMTEDLLPPVKIRFVKGFKAPGWQISDDVRRWLIEHGWWIADHVDNLDKRKKYPGKYYMVGENSSHHHCWDCVGNGVYEQKDMILERIKDVEDFKFVSEVVQ